MNECRSGMHCRARAERPSLAYQVNNELLFAYILDDDPRADGLVKQIREARPIASSNRALPAHSSPFLRSIRSAIRQAHKARFNGDHEEAENVLLAAQLEVERISGCSSPAMIDIYLARAANDRDRGRLLVAEALLLQALWSSEQLFGLVHELTAVVILHLANVALRKGREPKAEDLCRLAYAILESLEVDAEVDILQAWLCLPGIREPKPVQAAMDGVVSKALRFLDGALSKIQAQLIDMLGESPRYTSPPSSDKELSQDELISPLLFLSDSELIQTLQLLAGRHLQAGKTRTAKKLAYIAVRIARSLRGDAHYSYAHCLLFYGSLLFQGGMNRGAIRYLHLSLAAVRAWERPSVRMEADICDLLAETYERLTEPDRCAEYASRSRRLRKEILSATPGQ
ncbi:MAG: tetratricopeptide repeat protein [Bdellovibrionota bacterium]